MKTEDRGQRTEDRGQKTEDRGQRTEPGLDAAVALQWTWKTPAMRDMAVAVCRLALARAESNGQFSANDLPEFNHGGTGIAGAIFHRLIADGILARVGHFVGDTFYPLIVSNPGGNKISVYRLANASLARALLRAHGQPPPELKQEVFA